MKLLHVLILLAASARAALLSDVVNSLQDGISIDDIRQGILPDFMNWDWSVDEIQESLGVDDNAWNDVETKVLNVPYVAPRSLRSISLTPPQRIRELQLWRRLDAALPCLGLQRTALREHPRLQRDPRQRSERLPPRPRHRRAPRWRTKPSPQPHLHHPLRPPR